MAREIINLTLSKRSIDELNRIRLNIGTAKIGAAIIGVGHVYSLVLGNSGNASRMINISLSEWEQYQNAADYTGLSKSYINTVNAIIRRDAC